MPRASTRSSAAATPRGRGRRGLRHDAPVADAVDRVRVGTASWTDPEFDPKRPALYYVRVLEIPTPRWTTYDAVRNGLPLLKDVPATIQERAWTSPIWYTP